jgi:hypothetical protein
VRKTLEEEKWGRFALAVFDLTREILKRRWRKIAVIYTPSSRLLALI